MSFVGGSDGRLADPMELHLQGVVPSVTTGNHQNASGQGFKGGDFASAKYYPSLDYSASLHNLG